MTGRASGLRRLSPKFPFWSNNNNNNTRIIAFFPGRPGLANTRKAEPFWILMKQKMMGGSGISWTICKSAPCPRQITMPPSNHSVIYRPDALANDLHVVQLMLLHHIILCFVVMLACPIVLENVTLTLTSDELESHILVNVSSTLCIAVCIGSSWQCKTDSTAAAAAVDAAEISLSNFSSCPLNSQSVAVISHFTNNFCFSFY